MSALPVALLLLADGRLPAGGHVHSGGVEQAVDTGRITDLASLGAWLVERTATLGAVEATLAAAAVLHGEDPDRLVAEADARNPVPALRDAARARGRALVRVAEGAFGPLDVPARSRDPGLPLAVATGVVVAALGHGPREAAVLVLHGGVAEPAQAAVRRLGLDPVGITRVLARLGPTIDATAEVAAACATMPSTAWPAPATPAFDLAAVTHAARDDRYFAT
jgi:urease accessory protein